MVILNTKSLATTLNNLSEAWFYRQAIPKTQRMQISSWLAERQGLPGSYANMFAPMETEFQNGITLYTGEKVRTKAATAHVLGEETCRALILLNTNTAGTKKALAQATQGMLERMKRESDDRWYNSGMYCCGTCSASMWRHLAVGGLDKNEHRLIEGLKALKAHRTSNGKWKRFPFYYTLLTLTEIDLPAVKAEKQYAAAACERILKRPAKDDTLRRRRHDLARRILETC
jgi:hypothetical protein